MEPLCALLARASEACRVAVEGYLADHHPDRRFQSFVLVALAAMEAGARAEYPLEPADLRFIAGAASDAAGVCRTRPPDRSIIALARGFDEAARACRRTVSGADASGEGAARWARFLYLDLDFEVRRSGDGWRVRGRGGGEAERRLLDVALEVVLPGRPSHRYGEIAVQVLAWHAVASAAG